MAGDKLFKPSNAPIRDPLSDKKMHGNIVNVPRYAHLGGLSSGKKADGHFKNEMSLKKPKNIK